MTNEVDNLCSEVEAVLNDVARLCYLVRDATLQREAADRLADFASAIECAKNAATDGGEANLLLGLCCLLSAVRHELLLYAAIKEDRAEESWNHLVSAQDSARGAGIAHDALRTRQLEGYHQKLYALERLLFPTQMFSSIGGTVKTSKCSLCRTESGSCGHIAGRAYDGHFCSRVIEEIELAEVSIVEVPANRRARVHAFSESGIMRDALTLRVIDPEDGIDDK